MTYDLVDECNTAVLSKGYEGANVTQIEILTYYCCGHVKVTPERHSEILKNHKSSVFKSEL